MFSWYPTINFHRGRKTHHFNYPKSPSLTDPGSVWNFPSYITGWWFQPLWNILVSWDDYSQYMEKYIIFQTTNQFLASTVKWGFLNCKLDPQSHGWTVSIRSAMGMITRIFVIIPSRDVRSRYYPKQPPKMTERTFITILEWDLTCLSFWGLLHV